MIPQYELKAEDIRAYTLDILKDHVKLDVAGYKCTTEGIPGCGAESQCRKQ